MISRKCIYDNFIEAYINEYVNVYAWPEAWINRSTQTYIFADRRANISALNT